MTLHPKERAKTDHAFDADLKSNSKITEAVFLLRRTHLAEPNVKFEKRYSRPIHRETVKDLKAACMSGVSRYKYRIALATPVSNMGPNCLAAIKGMVINPADRKTYKQLQGLNITDVLNFAGQHRQTSFLEFGVEFHANPKHAHVIGTGEPSYWLVVVYDQGRHIRVQSALERQANPIYKDFLLVRLFDGRATIDSKPKAENGDLQHIGRSSNASQPSEFVQVLARTAISKDRGTVTEPRHLAPVHDEVAPYVKPYLADALTSGPWFMLITPGSWSDDVRRLERRWGDVFHVLLKEFSPEHDRANDLEKFNVAAHWVLQTHQVELDASSSKYIDADTTQLSPTGIQLRTYLVW
ncbi:hypothetical protein CALCODRAFT_513445 [Calocera cornea HHB12733]|uniref:Uncharacterized protein n=1 Tax=Calocera cornea HHB12733 TaxID=1353952 RepID=A0A165C343_9BASI|nr:hypothetical protein CALCODRAFT_513445 [Calocera cornea HHB12733]